MFRSLRLSVSLLGLIGVLAALGVALEGLEGERLMAENATEVFVSKDVVADILPPPMYLIEARLVLSQAVEGTLAPQRAETELARLTTDYDARVRFWQEHPPYGLERQLLGAQHEAALAFLAAARERVLAPLVRGERDAARANLGEVDALYQAHRREVDRTVREGNALAEASMAAFEATRSRSTTVALVIGVVAVVLIVLAYLRVLRSILSPVRRSMRLAKRIASGDLTRDARRDLVGRTDEVGQLEDALEDMRARLGALVDGVRDSAQSVASASGQIAASTLDLGRRTEQEAASLEETSSTATTLGAGVRDNAARAREASTLASGASSVAAEAGTAVERVVETVRAIETSSKKIAEITSMIDELAFQTNILALNAAVEAARAGDQGRGFAVVASEVRSLAQRSADASREIKSLIEASVRSTSEGAALADRAGLTMRDVVGSIRQVSAVIADIARTSTEQSASVAEVSAAVASIDASTQQNAALVEESAAAASSLEHEARALVASVAVFRTSSESSSAPAPAANVAPPRSRAALPADVRRAA